MKKETTEKKPTSEELKAQLAKENMEIDQKCWEEIIKVLEKYNRELTSAMLVTSQGNIQQFKLVVKE